MIRRSRRTGTTFIIKRPRLQRQTKILLPLKVLNKLIPTLICEMATLNRTHRLQYPEKKYACQKMNNQTKQSNTEMAPIDWTVQSAF